VPAVSRPNPINGWGASIVYDAQDGYVLVYGGSAGGDHTWTYSNGQWSLLDVKPYPSSRTAASMVYDSADHEAILFGGEYHPPASSGTGNNSSNSTHTSYYSDTWAFHGGQWYNITNPSDSPPARITAMMTYDGTDGYVVLYGGRTLTSFLDDTWTFLSGTWTNISASIPSSSTPSCRVAAGISYDAAAGYVVMFGGSEKNSTSPCYAAHGNVSSNQTWSFSHGEWTLLTPSVTPAARWAESLTYDASTGDIVMFGGVGVADTALTDTWVLSGGQWSRLHSTLYPPGRFTASMVYDPSTRSVLMFGGLSEPQKDAPILADFWSFSGSQWSNLTLIASPPPVSSMSLAYDEKDGYVLLFGGQNASGAYLSETWRFVGGVWLGLAPPISPPARGGASMAYDPTAGYVLLFGGSNGTTLFNDSWAYERGHWEPITVIGGAPPSPRADASLAFDEINSTLNLSQMILFGGNGTSGLLGDTWSFVNLTSNQSHPNGTWAELTPSVSPPARAGASMTYCPTQRTLVLFGGLGSSGLLQDTWQFLNGTWSELSPYLSPSPREFAGFVYDPNDGFGLLFGGISASGTLNDSWSYLNGVWTNITVWSPSSRSGAGLTFDAADDVVVLFGGDNGFQPLGDTWRYAANNWSQLLPLPTPSPSGPAGKSATRAIEYLVTVIVPGAFVGAIALVISSRRHAPARRRKRAELESAEFEAPPRAETTAEEPVGPKG
jgi:hypothetical protein